MSTYNTPVELLGIFTTPAPTEYIPGLRLSITSSGKIGLFWGKHQFFDAKPFLSDVATPISPPTRKESLPLVKRFLRVVKLTGQCIVIFSYPSKLLTLDNGVLYTSEKTSTDCISSTTNTVE